MKDTESEISSTTCCTEFPLPVTEDADESSTVAGTSVEEVKEVVEIAHSDCPSQEMMNQKETESTNHTRSCNGGGTTERDNKEGENGVICNEMEDMCEQFVLKIEESDERMREETSEGKADREHDSSNEQDTQICGTHNDIWEELEDIVSEVIEDEEKAQSEREGDVGQEHLVKDEQDEEHGSKEMVEDDKEEAKKTEGMIEIDGEPVETAEGAPTSLEMQQEFNKDETQRETHEKMASKEDSQEHVTAEAFSDQPENESDGKQTADEQLETAPSEDNQFKEVGSDMKEGRESEKSDGPLEGVGSTLVSSQPKIYQVKAVPVVPPKPQHCRITALTIRQQQQQRERRDGDRGRDNTLRVPGEQDKDGDQSDEGSEKKESPKLRGDSREREGRRDRAEVRNSPLSMCFDEAVAIATMRREKERVREGEAEADALGK